MSPERTDRGDPEKQPDERNRNGARFVEQTHRGATMNTLPPNTRIPIAVAITMSLLSVCLSLFCVARGSILTQKRIASTRFALVNDRDQTLGWVESDGASGGVSLVLFLGGREQRYNLTSSADGQALWQKD